MGLDFLHFVAYKMTGRPLNSILDRSRVRDGSPPAAMGGEVSRAFFANALA